MGRNRRCTAKNRKGERCNKAPIRGGYVCAMHGGNIPQVRAAAQRRMFALQEPAIDGIARFLENRPACDKCGRIDADRDPTVLKACQIILDRTGFGPTSKLEVEQTSDVLWMQYLEEDEVEQIIKIMEEAKTRIPADDVIADEEVVH